MKAWWMLKDRLHFPPTPFCDASLPPGCKEEFSPTCWSESVMLTHSNTCRSGCVIFICLFMFSCQSVCECVCVYVWYGSTSLHTLWLNHICEAFEAWLVNMETGVRVLFQGDIACLNWKKEKQFHCAQDNWMFLQDLTASTVHLLFLVNMLDGRSFGRQWLSG